MVLILVAHVLREACNLICLRDLFTHRQQSSVFPSPRRGGGAWLGVIKILGSPPWGIPCARAWLYVQVFAPPYLASLYCCNHYINISLKIGKQTLYVYTFTSRTYKTCCNYNILSLVTVTSVTTIIYVYTLLHL